MTLPQLNLKEPNPYKRIIVEPSLKPQSRFVDYNLVLKKKTLKEYGAYAGLLLPGKKVIPVTTPAIVIDYGRWLLENNRAGRRGADPGQELKLVRRLTAYQREVMSWYNKEVQRSGILKSSPRYTHLLRTTVIPATMAREFWYTTGKMAIHLDAAKTSPTFLKDLKMLGSLFWERTREVAKGLGQAAAKGFGWLVDMLKWMAILFGVGIGGLILLNIVSSRRRIA